MALDDATTFLVAFHAVLLGVVAMAIVVVGRLLAPPAWVDRPDAAARWGDEAQSVVDGVEGLLDPETGVTVSDDRTQRRLLSLSSRLDRHAELAPAAVDDELVLGITELGYGCRVVAMELTHAERLDWEVGAPNGTVTAVRTTATDLQSALDDCMAEQ